MNLRSVKRKFAKTIGTLRRTQQRILTKKVSLNHTHSFFRLATRDFYLKTKARIIFQPNKHHEGEFDFVIKDRLGNILGWVGCTAALNDRYLKIESIQGQKGAKKNQNNFFNENNEKWANALVSHLIKISRQSGLKSIYLTKPIHQEYVGQSKSVSESQGLYYSIKNAFKFRNLPPYSKAVPIEERTSSLGSVRKRQYLIFDANGNLEIIHNGTCWELRL